MEEGCEQNGDTFSFELIVGGREKLACSVNSCFFFLTSELQLGKLNFKKDS